MNDLNGEFHDAADVDHRLFESDFGSPCDVDIIATSSSREVVPWNGAEKLVCHIGSEVAGVLKREIDPTPPNAVNDTRTEPCLDLSELDMRKDRPTHDPGGSDN